MASGGSAQAFAFSSQRLAGAMVAISVSVCLATLDTSITNTALPAIAAQLRISAPSVIWVVTAYQLMMTAAILPLASLGEAIGHRRIFVSGLAIFIIASALCGLASTFTMLVAARAVQGLGAAAIMSANTALIRQIYPDSRLGKGLGLNSLVIALGFASGPVIASAILSVASWHWIFLINIPIGIAGMILTLKKLPVNRSGISHPDKLSALFCFIAFALLIMSLLKTEAKAWWQVIGCVLVSACCLVMLIYRERDRQIKVLPVDLFRNAVFSFSSLSALFAFAAQGLAMVIFPFFLLEWMKRDPREIGLLIAPWPIFGALMAPISGMLSDRFSPGYLSAAGMFILTLALLCLGSLSSDVANPLLAINIAVCGFGFGLFLSPNQRAIMSGAPPGRGGGASGILGVTRLLGQSTGAAIVALFLAQSTALSTAYALWCGAIIACLAALSCLVKSFVAGADSR